MGEGASSELQSILLEGGPELLVRAAQAAIYSTRQRGPKRHASPDLGVAACPLVLDQRCSGVLVRVEIHAGLELAL